MAAKTTSSTPPARDGAGSAPASNLTVSQLAGVIERALREGVPLGLRVLGEIGQFRERTHWYFDLKDDASVVSCVMFASAARRSGFTPAQGQQVVATGRVEYYGKQGRTQFMVDRLEPVGVGALDLAFRKLCDELRALGWFDEARKRPLPSFPRRVAVVTSRSAAALQDVLDTAQRKCSAIPISLVDVRVQGETAAQEITSAVRMLSRHHSRFGIDVVLLTRGGGSMEDLWCFNDRQLAEAIVRCPVPVVAAIGHETDTTIAELVADLRGATPTQAAMRIFPDSAALARQLEALGSRLTAQVRRHLVLDRERLRSAARHPALTDPEATLDRARERLAAATRGMVGAEAARLQTARIRLERATSRLERHRPAAVYAQREAGLIQARSALEAAIRVRIKALDPAPFRPRLDSAVKVLLEKRQAALLAAARSLDLVGPHNVLRRGYSVTLGPDGRPIRSFRAVVSGDRIATRVADGQFESTVGAGDAKVLPASSQPTARSVAVRARKPKPDDGHPGLFGD